MHKLGLAADEIDQYVRERRTEPDLVVSPVEYDAIRLFSRIQTQWLRDGFSGSPTGLNYVNVEVVARVVGIALSDEILRYIQIMEAAVISETLERKRDG